MAKDAEKAAGVRRLRVFMEEHSGEAISTERAEAAFARLGEFARVLLDIDRHCCDRAWVALANCFPEALPCCWKPHERRDVVDWTPEYEPYRTWKRQTGNFDAAWECVERTAVMSLRVGEERGEWEAVLPIVKTLHHETARLLVQRGIMIEATALVDATDRTPFDLLDRLGDWSVAIPLDADRYTKRQLERERLRREWADGTSS